VAKTRYSDHGDHQHKTPSQQENVLKKMTMNCKENYRLWQSETAASKGKGRKKRVVSSSTQAQQPPIGQDTQHQKEQEQQGQEHDEPQPQQQAQPLEQQGAQGNVDLSPQRFAFSQLALETGEGQQQQQQHQHEQVKPRDPRHHGSGSGHLQQVSDQLPQKLFSQKEQHKGNHGLSAVIEQSSQTSSRTHGTQSKGASESVASRSSSIATKSTMGEQSAFRNASSLPRGKCLTQPPEPITNDNLDNCDGNLIAFENDTMRVGRKQIHSVTKDKIPNVSTMDFRIQSLLGQGTFAQVFQCLHLQTGKIVAVKIVKNKPAYTRQAVVEIDVFRALTKNDEANAANNKVLSSSQSQTGHRASSPAGGGGSVGGTSLASTSTAGTKWDYMVNLECYFMYKNHLCLVFELLGLNLYEVLKRRQFRGLPLPVVRTLVRQAIRGVKELAQKSIVHCDLKPENILLATEDDVELVVSAGEGRRLSSSLEKSKSSSLMAAFEQKSNKMEPPTKVSGISSALGIFPTQPGNTTPTTQATTEHIPQTPGSSVATPLHLGLSSYQKIKLIDFGSACFEGQTAHTYIQSRFYRSPEVLIGLPYDSAIDTWSLGCVAAELFLGLPILPGVHEHDQLCRVSEMISNLPAWMLDAGSKSSKYFVKYVPRPESRNQSNPSPSPIYFGGVTPTPRPQLPQWRVKTQQEYISSLSQSEIRKKGGLAKLEKQPTNRYFKRKKLSDIILHKGQNNVVEDKESLELFVHFLYGKHEEMYKHMCFKQSPECLVLTA
jgi:serine/threonine protein kinase